jgi:uncharacterized membrane protein YgcG
MDAPALGWALLALLTLLGVCLVVALFAWWLRERRHRARPWPDTVAKYRAAAEPTTAVRPAPRTPQSSRPRRDPVADLDFDDAPARPDCSTPVRSDDPSPDTRSPDYGGYSGGGYSTGHDSSGSSSSGSSSSSDSGSSSSGSSSSSGGGGGE